jgi:hypothetical protein
LTRVIAGCKNPALKSKGEAMKVPTDLMRRVNAASAIGEQHNVICINTESPLACHFVHTAYSRGGSMSKFLRAVYCFVFLCTASIAALAQLSTATAFGNVTDSTGAEISNATVVFTQTQTNFTRFTKTNSQGEYRAEFLPVGPYTVKVDAPRFKEIVQTGILLTVTQQATLNFSGWGTTFRQQPLLFHNLKGEQFEVIPPVKGTGLGFLMKARGAAVGDIFYP